MPPSPRHRARTVRSVAASLLVGALIGGLAGCGGGGSGGSGGSSTNPAMMNQAQMDQLQRILSSAVTTTTAAP